MSTYAGGLNDSRLVDGNLTSALFVSPKGIVFDRQGNLFVLDAGQLPVVGGETAKQTAAIRKISTDGQVSTFVGAAYRQGSSDGVGSAVTLNAPTVMTINPATGTIYVADTGNHTIRKVSKDGSIRTLVGVVGQAGITLGALPGGVTAPTGIMFVPPDKLYVTTLCAILMIAPLTD